MSGVETGHGHAHVSKKQTQVFDNINKREKLDEINRMIEEKFGSMI